MNKFDLDASNKDRSSLWALIIGLSMISIISLSLYGATEYRYNELKSKQGEIIDEMFYLVEGTVIAISEDGGTLYCVSDYTPNGYVDEVDVFDEVLCDCSRSDDSKNCWISVGDTVLYSVDKDWQDADLIVKIHE